MLMALNESPSEKEGKFPRHGFRVKTLSMDPQ